MWSSTSRLSAISQVSLWTRANAHIPIRTTTIPLKHSKPATVRRTRRWRRCGSEVVVNGRMQNVLGEDYHGTRTTPGGLGLSVLAPNGGAQFSDDLLRRFDRLGVLIDRKRNRSHAGVSTASVAFTDPGQIHLRLLRGPGIRSH